MNAQNPFPAAATMKGYQTITSSCSETDQIRLYNGNLLKVVRLVNVGTVGLSLAFKLVYNSLMSTAMPSPVGNKWRHNYMRSLAFSGMPTSLVTFTDQGGRQYNYVPSGSSWVPSGTSLYLPATLVQNVGNWQLQFADGSLHTFDTSGVLQSSTDRNGNVTTYQYTSGNLTSITGPTGRTITLGWTGSFITSVTDPNGNTTTLVYDLTHSNLTQVVGPAGCTLTYGYATPSNSLITSRTDPNSNVYSYTYNGSSQLTSVTDAESPSHTITYAYDTVTEYIADNPITTLSLARTTLTDPFGNPWEYRFDQTGMLWRTISPVAEGVEQWRRFFWDANQQLLYTTTGFPYVVNNAGTGDYAGPRDSPNNAFRRRITDDTLARPLFHADATGKMNQYTYNSGRRTTSQYPGQGHLGIQGNWVGQYGTDGYILCAFDSSSADVESLPGYMSSVSMGTATRSHLDNTSYYDRLMDPRALLHPTTLHKANGYWQSSSAFTMTFTLSSAQEFNLSFYANSTDLDYANNSPLNYQEQTGRDVTFTVTDISGTQTFRVSNNAGGQWVTFPVQGDTSHDITVQVAPSGANTGDARVSAIMFDPHDSHQTSYGYDGANNLTSVTNGLGSSASMAYNANGTVSSSTDMNSHTTHYFYEDAFLNLTRVEDPYGFNTRYTYDLNGNMLTRTDANGHTWAMTYDDKNRPLTTTDPLGLVSSIEYDSAGNVLQTTDQNGHQTTMVYTPTNRLQQITDAAGNVTQYRYDQGGYPLTVTDSRGHVTSFLYDQMHRLIQTTRADGSIVTQAWDTQSHLVATTTPNGNQANLSDINLTNAANLLWNPGFELTTPSNSLLAQGWTLNGNGNVDDTVSHSGQNSFSLMATISANQQSVFQAPSFPPGARGLGSFWARPDGSTNPTTVWANLAVSPVAGAPQPVLSPMLPLPTSSTSWEEMPLFRVDVRGDSQFVDSPINAFSLLAQSQSGTPDVWFDDAALYSLSTAMSYDSEGRLVVTQGPDGSVTQKGYDRFGRLAQVVDANRNVTTMQYDSLGRMTSVTDALGNVTSYAYDNNGNRTSVTDPNSNVTNYQYDHNNRLTQITYPDSTTEQFIYDPVGNIVQYTNNNSQVFSMTYDAKNRLVERLYNTDSTTVQYGYDPVGNLLCRVERNGDICWYNYDVINRLVAVEKNPSGGFSYSDSWLQRHVYDSAGNRLEFDNGTNFDNGTGGATAGIYGTGHYGTDEYGTGAVAGVYGTATYGSGLAGTPPFHWRVPGQYDDMNRLTAYQDRQFDQTMLAYDIESRLATGITYPNGSPNVTGAAAYDVMSRLWTSDVSQSATDILPIQYGYDRNGNRLAVVTGADTFNYDVDAGNRLVTEDINRFVERSLARFQRGMVNGVDVTAGNLSLIALADTFSGNLLDIDRWSPLLTRNEFPGGLEVRQNGSLLMTFPRGFSSTLAFFSGGSANQFTQPPVNNFGLSGSYVWGGVQHNVPLTGDFDLQLTFNDFQGFPQGMDNAALTLVACDTSLADVLDNGGSSYVMMRIDSTPQYHSTISNVGVVTDNTASTSDTSGMLRIVRSGSTATTYYWNGSSWTTLGTVSGFVTDTMSVAIAVENAQVFVSASVSDFQSNLSAGQYGTSGTYTSTVYDAGNSVTWDTIQWDATVPAGATLAFQIATSSSSSAPFSFVGPDGTSATFFTTSGTSIHSGTTGRYAQYQATLTGNGAVTPNVTRVDLLFSGANTSSAYTYGYDGSGNMTGKVTEVSGSTTVTETRTVNSLNQITANSVVGASTTNWSFTFDANGNMTRTNTTLSQTTTYSWDEDNRLILVTLPSAATVAYTYDRLGRMLSRTDSSGATTFVWDRWNCVQETDPSGNVTRYYVVNGRLMSFDRTVSGTTSVYQVHADALGSIRKVTNSSGAVVATYDYDAWANQLSSTSDSIPNGGLQYRYVGSYGVRWDSATGLYYMRRRWFDPALARFISRDSKKATNLYKYCANQPTRQIDPTGKQGMSTGVGTINLFEGSAAYAAMDQLAAAALAIVGAPEVLTACAVAALVGGIIVAAYWIDAQGNKYPTRDAVPPGVDAWEVPDSIPGPAPEDPVDGPGTGGTTTGGTTDTTTTGDNAEPKPQNPCAYLLAEATAFAIAGDEGKFQEKYDEYLACCQRNPGLC